MIVLHGLADPDWFYFTFSFRVWSGRGGSMPSSRRAVEPMQQPHLAASIAKARAMPQGKQDMESLPDMYAPGPGAV